MDTEYTKWKYQHVIVSVIKNHQITDILEGKLNIQEKNSCCSLTDYRSHEHFVFVRKKIRFNPDSLEIELIDGRKLIIKRCE